MSKKDKLLKLLKENINASQRSLLDAFQVTEQKDTIVFRMHASFFALQDLWTEIEAIAEKHKYKVSRMETFATVEELDAILSNIEWLWHGNIPLGFMTLIAGEPGIGKSLDVLDLTRIITTGDYFPNSEERAPIGSVLWIETEMKQQLLNSRSKSLGVDRKKLFIPSINGNLLTKFDASDDKHVSHIIDIIEEKKPVMIVVDSLGHSHSKGENRIEEVRPIMDFFTGLARDYNVAVVVIHHLNKGREGETAEISLSRVRGSTDIVATPVVIFSLERGPEADTIKIRQIKNNIGRPQEPILAKLLYHDDKKEQIKQLQYSAYKAPPPKKGKAEACSEWLLSVLSDKQQHRMLDLISKAEGEGFTRANIYSAKTILGEQVRLTGDGKTAFWQLAGEAEIDHNAVQQIKKGMKGKKK